MKIWIIKWKTGWNIFGASFSEFQIFAKVRMYYNNDPDTKSGYASSNKIFLGVKVNFMTFSSTPSKVRIGISFLVKIDFLVSIIFALLVRVGRSTFFFFFSTLSYLRKWNALMFGILFTYYSILYIYKLNLVYPEEGQKNSYCVFFIFFFRIYIYKKKNTIRIVFRPSSGYIKFHLYLSYVFHLFRLLLYLFYVFLIFHFSS